MTCLICRNNYENNVRLTCFKGVISYQDLVKCFSLVIQSLQRGAIQPWVGSVVCVCSFSAAEQTDDGHRLCSRLPEFEFLFCNSLTCIHLARVLNSCEALRT